VAEAGAESQVLEWKSSLAERKRGLESLCGMLNAEPARGTVEFGIGPHGEVVGVEAADLDKTQRSLAQEIGQSFQPRIQLTIRAEERGGKRVIVVEGRRNRDVPYHEYDGRAWVREGTATRQLNPAEKQSLQRQRNRDLHSGPWKCDRCGSWVGVLASVTLTPQGPMKSYDCHCGGEYWPA
jgi:predicted HTH transcriptional regulator